MAWNSPEIIACSKDKEETACQFGYIIGGMLLVFAIFKSTKDAINALKSDIHVQYMVTSAKLQMQGIISKSDAITALAGKISSILKCVEGSFTVEAMKYLEQYLTAEKGSRFLEVVRKLEKELGDKIELDTTAAKKIVESLDDGMSVDEVVEELKAWCERGGFGLEDLLTNPNQLSGVSGEELYNYLVENGYDVKPLSKGSLKGIPFEDGGGFKVNWGGDRILQYHPVNYSHHGGAYYKISSGETGTIRVNID